MKVNDIGTQETAYRAASRHVEETKCFVGSIIWNLQRNVWDKFFIIQSFLEERKQRNSS
jgi:squalene cyclase